jgi:hypothetical protein
MRQASLPKCADYPQHLHALQGALRLILRFMSGVLSPHDRSF